LDGFEVARRIREDPNHSDMWLVALTGYGQASDRATAQRAGFDEHLVKPVDTDQLLKLLAELREASSPRPARARRKGKRALRESGSDA
jgi:two-component system CheB/CheR fusion protein